MPDKEIMVQIRELEGQLGWRFYESVNTEPEIETVSDATGADALAQLAGDWRALADLYDKAKGKGFKTAHVDPLRAAARKLDEVIDQLRKPRRAPLGQLQPAGASALHVFVPDVAGEEGATCVVKQAGAPCGARRASSVHHVLAIPRPVAVHRFEVDPYDGRTCDARQEDGEPCGQLPGAAVHNLAAMSTVRTGTVPPVESLDALIADSVARHRALDAEGVPDFRGPGDLADPNVGREVQRLDVPANAGRAEITAAESTFPGQVTDTDVAAYLSGALDDLPADFGPPLAPSTVTDASRHGGVYYDPAEFVAAQNEEFDREERALQPTAPTMFQQMGAEMGAEMGAIIASVTPPVPLLGQPGDAGAGYAPTYVPPGGVPATFVELMTPVPVAALPAHISHSQIGGVGECPAKYRLTRLNNGEYATQIPQWANIGGTVFHAVIEAFERMVIDGGSPGMLTVRRDPMPAGNGEMIPGPWDIDSDASWRTYFDVEVAKIEASSPVPRSRWRASKQGAEGETWWNANGPEMIKRYLAARPPGSTANLPGVSGAIGDFESAIELERAVPVPTPYGPIDYRAIIDRVTVRTDPATGVTTLVIRDYKTGDRMPSDTQQLGEYANVLRLLGVPPQVKIVGTYFNARKGVWTPEVDLEAEGGGGWTAEWFVYHVTTGHAQRLALTTGPTPARPSSFCGGCPVRWACPIKGVKR